MNKDELHNYVLNSTGNESNICQICAVKDGNTAYEDCWHGFSANDAVNVMSVTKGVMSLITGIAIDKGYIKDVDQKVLDFFPSYQVKRGEKTIYDVTLRHLLTMTAPYKYRSEPWKKSAHRMTGLRQFSTFWAEGQALQANSSMRLSVYRSYRV